ncbi:hypothetical protein [Actimicrobium sp. CCI2.3]|uniref:hypothetical protein n=1 Tax=Actimicrobium sp. CCI2.3 TaxID=3048616 RepID=UPI002AB5A858|nr:hypothetical protein [Actimicrobium sp. CCI2.3]MDY7575114.1 hypothetical protein [Actimicrobium sp. CCI2.3]MEB0022545.1 hypothetical protein [Actimicrobium sp. CCI2.3]
MRYLQFESATQQVRLVNVAITQSPQFIATPFDSNQLFGPVGKKFYIGGGSTGGASVVAEIDTSSDTNSRVLVLPSNGAEYHYLTSLKSSVVDDRFVLVAFLFEHRIHTASEPHSVGFIDVSSGTILANVSFPQGMFHSTLFGDVLDPCDHGKNSTTAALILPSGSVALDQPLVLTARINCIDATGHVPAA